MIILDRTTFYPTSGGQKCDLGTLTINNIVYNVTNCEKVGRCAVHMLDREVPDTITEGTSVIGQIDTHRRTQLKAHHTATHIIFSACRQVLGPHVWQHGASKTEQYAHIDITHYSNVSGDEEKLIENISNKIVQKNANITKTFYNKRDAELNWGFDL